MSAANVVETSLVLRGLKRITSKQAEQWLDEFLLTAGIHVEQVTAKHAQLARRAHIQFGKETGHSAGLNFGDCFAYALARATGEALLFKGDDSAGPTSSQRCRADWVSRQSSPRTTRFMCNAPPQSIPNATM